MRRLFDAFPFPSRQSFESVRRFALAIRRFCKRTVASLCSGLGRLAEMLYSIGNRTVGRRRVTRVASLVLFACMSLVLMGFKECTDYSISGGDKGVFALLWGIVSLATEGDVRLLPASGEAALPRLVTGTDGSQTGVANFAGNLNAISAPPQARFLLARLKDCSLDLLMTTSATDTGTVVTNYDRTLHQLAGLNTTPDVFAQGCTPQNSGLSSAPGVWVGFTPTAGVFASVSLDGISIVDANSTVTATDDTALPNAEALAISDFNKDGIGDLLVVNGVGSASASVSVLLGNTDGTFKSPVSYSIAGTFAVAAVIEDVNGDGKLDIVAVSADQQISVLPGNGDGTFQSATSFAAPTLPGFASSGQTPIVNLITADVNGDGKKDVICSNGLVLLGKGDGTFTAAAAPAFPYVQASSDEGPNLAAGDINNDSKIDLVVGTGSSVSIWLGKGDGSFTQGNSYASANSTGFVTVADLDGDGNADIYVGLSNGGVFSGDDSNPNLAYVLMGRGDGTFSGAPIAPGTYSGNNLADLNGDGVPDLVSNAIGPFGNTVSPSFTVALGTGNGGFATKSTVTAPDTFALNGYNFTGVSKANAAGYAVGDVNDDGKPDLVFVGNGLTAQNTGASMASQSPFPVYFVALGNGDGTFQTPKPYAFPQVAPAPGLRQSALRYESADCGL